MPTLAEFVMSRPPTADQPLMGLTVLLVEDSRFAAEGVRLMCRASGARLRRADSLAAAARHLGAYRPNVVIVDLGLPDGPGTELIAELSRGAPGLDAVIAVSADPAMQPFALRAGADGFLAKPFGSLAAFQTAILSHLPPERQPSRPRRLPDSGAGPDALTLREDLEQALAGLRAEGADLDYMVQFLTGLARSAGDEALVLSIDALGFGPFGPTGPEACRRLAELVERRLCTMEPAL